MKTIISPNTDYRRFFPPFPLSSSYCKQQFCIRKDIEDKKEAGDASLLFNTLSGELVLLDSKEDELWCGASDDDISVDNEFWLLLAAHDFIVPKGTDMMELLAKGRAEAMKLLHKVSSLRPGFFRYTVFTTLDCNARCFYCYQKKTPKLSMSDDAALKTARFFEKNYRENEAPVKIKWFGGEPLLNQKAIDIITGYLTVHHIPFSSDMTSNGYLFTPDIQEKALKEWNLKDVQITLDGTEEIYNRCKAYVYSKSECESPFKRVVNNIVTAAGNGIDVMVRMNVDSHNADNLLELLNYLKPKVEELKGHVKFYSHPLFIDSPHPDYENRPEVLFEYELKLKNRISSLHACQNDPDDGLESGMALSYCMVDNIHSLTILPDGHIGKCEHHTQDMFVGDLDEGVNQEAVSPMVKFNDFFERCRECPFPPQCFYLKLCVSDFTQECRYQFLKKSSNAVRGMRYAYENKLATISPTEMTFVPKIREAALKSSPLEVLAISHCKYAVRGRNGNCLSIHFITSLDLGSHSIQNVKVEHIGGKHKFVEPDKMLLDTLAFIMMAYLREHNGDILLFSFNAEKKGKAIQKFIKDYFDKSVHFKESVLLQYEGKGIGGRNRALSMILLKDCPEFDDVCQALSEQVDEISLNNDEVMTL